MAGLPQPRASRDQPREERVGGQVRVDALRRGGEGEQAGDVKGLAVGEQQPPLRAGAQTGRSRRTSRSTGATRSSRGSPSREVTSRTSWTVSVRRSPPDPSI